MTIMNKVLMLIASAALGGLAMTTTGLADHKSDHENDRHDDDTLRYGPDPRIGEEVRSICFGRSINGWRAVKGEDDVVLLQRGVSHWYRVELLGACDYRVLRSAIAIGIDSRPSGGCITRGDAIIVEDSQVLIAAAASSACMSGTRMLSPKRKTRPMRTKSKTAITDYANSPR